MRYLLPILFITSTALAADDLCTGGTALADSTYTGYQPSYAFDDNTATCWPTNTAAGSTSGTAYIGYHLTAAYSLASIAIKNGCPTSGSGRGITSVIVQYSDNGTNWTTDSTHALTDDSGAAFQDMAVTETNAHEYWRVLANANPTYRWHVPELEMYENTEEPPEEPGDPGTTDMAEMIWQLKQLRNQCAEYSNDFQTLIGDYGTSMVYYLRTGSAAFPEETTQDVSDLHYWAQVIGILLGLTAGGIMFKVMLTAKNQKHLLN